MQRNSQVEYQLSWARFCGGQEGMMSIYTTVTIRNKSMLIKCFFIKKCAVLSVLECFWTLFDLHCLVKSTSLPPCVPIYCNFILSHDMTTLFDLHCLVTFFSANVWQFCDESCDGTSIWSTLPRYTNQLNFQHANAWQLQDKSCDDASIWSTLSRKKY